jgi:hypothetical protein
VSTPFFTPFYHIVADEEGNKNSRRTNAGRENFIADEDRLAVKNLSPG